MKKIIGKKCYDSDRATEVASWCNGHYTSDFAYCEETLYRSPGGIYFLHGKGGALSAYAGSHGNSTGWGEEIRVMGEGEIRAWAEERDVDLPQALWAECGVEEA